MAYKLRDTGNFDVWQTASLPWGFISGRNFGVASTGEFERWPGGRTTPVMVESHFHRHPLAMSRPGSMPVIFIQKALTLEPSSIIGHWILNDFSNPITNAVFGRSTVTLVGGTFRNGTFKEGSPAPTWGTGYIDLYSAINTLWNGNEYTISMWVKPTASWWSGGSLRKIISIYVNTQNYTYIQSSVDNVSLWFERRGGNTQKLAIQGTSANTNWFHVALTASASRDRVRAFYNGTQVGADLTGIGTWTGSLSTTQTVIGATNTSSTSPFAGNMSCVTIWNTALRANQIPILATV